MEEANKSGEYFNHKSLLSMNVCVHVSPQEWQQTDVKSQDIFSPSVVVVFISYESHYLADQFKAHVRGRANTPKYRPK